MRCPFLTSALDAACKAHDNACNHIEAETPDSKDKLDELFNNVKTSSMALKQLVNTRGIPVSLGEVITQLIDTSTNIMPARGKTR